MNPQRVRWGLAIGLGLGAAVLCGGGVAAAAPENGSGSTQSEQTRRPAASSAARVSAPRRAAVTTPGATAAATSAVDSATPQRPQRQVRGRVLPSAAAPMAEVPVAEVPVAEVPVAEVAESTAATVTVDLPPMPVTHNRGFTVSEPAVTDAATAYVDGGGDPSDAPRFFFGDLATGSLDTLASVPLTRDQERVEMGNLAVSGYFGGIWLRDDLRPAPTQAAQPVGALPPGGVISALGLRMFGAFVAGLTDISRVSWLSTPAAHSSVPVLLSLYGYNKGYLEYLLDNPPPGVPSMRDTLTCKGFLDCNSSLVDLEIANRYDSALVDLAHPPTLRWAEMKLWTTVLESTTGAGRFVWEIITPSGGFSPTSYAALVDLSSAYLMISKATTLASMKAYGERDAHLASAALLLQAGLWMWSGAYFSGLASNAPRGTIPSIVVTSA